MQINTIWVKEITISITLFSKMNEWIMNIEHWKMNIATSTDQRAGIAGIRCVILQVAWQAKIRNFAHQVAVDQNVACSQVTVHIVHFWEILHPGWDPTHHSHQLDHCELTIILLEDREDNKQKLVFRYYLWHDKRKWAKSLPSANANIIAFDNEIIMLVDTMLTKYPRRECCYFKCDSLLNNVNEKQICSIFWYIIYYIYILQTTCSLDGSINSVSITAAQWDSSPKLEMPCCISLLP